eukprot:706602-Alexandrium_andersonii.AAC.1
MLRVAEVGRHARRGRLAGGQTHTHTRARIAHTRAHARSCPEGARQGTGTTEGLARNGLRRALGPPTLPAGPP